MQLFEGASWITSSSLGGVLSLIFSGMFMAICPGLLVRMVGAPTGTNRAGFPGLGFRPNPLFLPCPVRALLIVSSFAWQNSGGQPWLLCVAMGRSRVLAVMVGLAALEPGGLAGVNAATRYGLDWWGAYGGAGLLVAAKTLPLGARQLQAAALGWRSIALPPACPNRPPFSPPLLNYESFWTLPGSIS